MSSIEKLSPIMALAWRKANSHAISTAMAFFRLRSEKSSEPTQTLSLALPSVKWTLSPPYALRAFSTLVMVTLFELCFCLDKD